ncbi:fructoselysine-6-P-deglycase FrlB-like protein [Skermanella aerolata]|uniref:SIS domain-containing protein n=1 Tax=Skermanella aerolata TaxID=393310 RepID=UPI003D21D82E
MNDVMRREIAAQAGILADCLEPLSARIGGIARPEGWIMAGGCGDSAFAPAALKGFFDAIGIQLEATTSMQLAGFTRYIAGDAIVLSSISGNTRRTVEAAHVARASGAHVVAVTCGKTSALAKEADDVVVLPFTPISRVTPHTLDYLVTVEALAVMGLHWIGEGTDPLIELFALMPRWSEAARDFAEDAVSAMDPAGKIFLLGGGPDLATAGYGAAKFHEAGGIPAIAAETENFIHGMNFMAEPPDSLFAIATAPLSIRRGAEVAANFRSFLTSTALIEPEPLDRGPFEPGGWQSALAALLSTTLKVQHLCLAYADRFGLDVTAPRAGRDFGAQHAEIQARIMAM